MSHNVKEKLYNGRLQFIVRLIQLLHTVGLVGRWQSKKTVQDSKTITFVNGEPHIGGIPTRKTNDDKHF